MGASAYPRQRLEEAAQGARTLSEALERLGVDPKGWKRRYVYERMKKLSVDVSHFEREGIKSAQRRSAAPCAESRRHGWVNHCPSRSTTSTATGGTTGS